MLIPRLSLLAMLRGREARLLQYSQQRRIRRPDSLGLGQLLEEMAEVEPGVFAGVELGDPSLRLGRRPPFFGLSRIAVGEGRLPFGLLFPF